MESFNPCVTFECIALRRLIELVGTYKTLDHYHLALPHPQFVSLSHRKVNTMDWSAYNDVVRRQRFIELPVNCWRISTIKQTSNSSSQRDERNFETAMTTEPNQTKPYQTERECVNMHKEHSGNASNIDYHRSKETNRWLQMTRGTSSDTLL